VRWVRGPELALPDQSQDARRRNHGYSPRSVKCAGVVVGHPHPPPSVRQTQLSTDSVLRKQDPPALPGRVKTRGHRPGGGRRWGQSENAVWGCHDEGTRGLAATIKLAHPNWLGGSEVLLRAPGVAHKLASPRRPAIEVIAIALEEIRQCLFACWLIPFRSKSFVKENLFPWTDFRQRPSWAIASRKGAHRAPRNRCTTNRPNHCFSFLPLVRFLQ